MANEDVDPQAITECAVELHRLLERYGQTTMRAASVRLAPALFAASSDAPVSTRQGQK